MFNVGDRVTVVANVYSGKTVNIGADGTIVGFDPDAVIGGIDYRNMVELDTRKDEPAYPFADSELKLVQPARTFKVGDMVRVVDGSYEGLIGAVLEDDGDPEISCPYWVDVIPGDANGYPHNATQLELVLVDDYDSVTVEQGDSGDETDFDPEDESWASAEAQAVFLAAVAEAVSNVEELETEMTHFSEMALSSQLVMDGEVYRANVTLSGDKADNITAVLTAMRNFLIASGFNYVEELVAVTDTGEHRSQ